LPLKRGIDAADVISRGVGAKRREYGNILIDHNRSGAITLSSKRRMMPTVNKNL
jgi:hypothetical protein